MTSHHITFEGPSALALGIATSLADADGIDLTASDPITKVDGQTVRLRMTAEGTFDAVASAIAGLRADLPAEATITVSNG